MRKLPLCLTIASLCLSVQAGERAVALMGRKLRPLPHLSRVPLTEALQWIGTGLIDDFVDFGVELDPQEATEPLVDVDFPVEGTFEGDLRWIFRQLPRYEYAMVSDHLVSVRPRGALADPNDILNTVVKDFDVSGVRAGEIMAWPDRYIEELQPAPAHGGKPHMDIVVGPTGTGPEVTIHLEGVTVREVLNAVSIATENSPDDNELPVGWVFAVQHPSPSVSVPNWRILIAVGGNWRKLQIRDKLRREASAPGAQPSH